MGIQMKQKEPTETFMKILNLKNPLVSMVYKYKKYFSVVRFKWTVSVFYLIK